MTKKPRPRKLVSKPKLLDLTSEEAEAIVHDWEDELFGEDADYMRYAGLADKVGNK